MVSTHLESFRVRSYECDLYGHVNNAIYLHYLQEASLAFSSAAGYPPDRYAALGLEWWPSRIDFEYLIPLRYGDIVDVSIRPDAISGPTLQQSFEYHNRQDWRPGGQREHACHPSKRSRQPTQEYATRDPGSIGARRTGTRKAGLAGLSQSTLPTAGNLPDA
jgi:YbgC/YbaW family acyl-CoA thioester hydrolase